MVVTYVRLLYNVVWNAGYLPRGSPCIEDQQEDTHPSDRPRRKHHRRRRSRRNSRTTEKGDRSETDVDAERGLEYGAGGKAYPLNIKGLESFYTKDVFVCQLDGRPSYCSTCCQFKTDRAHHCREVNRCVRKMDHFCPWYVLTLAFLTNEELTSQGWGCGLGNILQILYSICFLHGIFLYIQSYCLRSVHCRT